jgi:hypothetical protein
MNVLHVHVQKKTREKVPSEQDAKPGRNDWTPNGTVESHVSYQVYEGVNLSYQAALHLEGLDLDHAEGILEELCLVFGRWRYSGHEEVRVKGLMIVC